MAQALPIEIWRIILRLATLPNRTGNQDNPIALAYDTVSGPARTKGQLNPPSSWRFPRRVSIDTPESRRTKITLAQVSLTFYDLVWDFLHENVYIDHEAAAARLETILARSRAAPVRYIYVRMNGRRQESSLDNFSRSIAHILQMSPRIRGMTWSSDIWTPAGQPDPVVTVIRSIPHSIEVLEWKDSGHDEGLERRAEILQLLKSTNTLRCLRLIGNFPQLEQPLAFPRLSHLQLKMQDDGPVELQHWKLPSLTHLCINIPWLDFDATFLQAPLSHLTFLSFSGYGPCLPNHIFQRVITSAPHLQSLIYHRNIGKEGPTWDALEHPSLRDVTLYNNMGGFIVAPLRSGRFPWLEDAVEDLKLHVHPMGEKRRFPALKSFTIVNLRHVRPNHGDRKVLHTTLLSAADILSQRNVEVKIED